MRIWIDLSNSPHVNFFAGLIRELRSSHEVLLTCRPLANTIELLDLYGFDYHVVGRHYGASKVMKILGFFIRTWQLWRFLRGRKIDVAVSQSSYYSPLVARLLGIRSIYTNDNEHAEGNRIGFLFSDRVMVPESMDMRRVRQQYARGRKVLAYPGVKEGLYLQGQDPAAWRRTGRTNGRKTIFVRPEPSTAQYYHARQNFMDEVLSVLAATEGIDVVVLPRSRSQRAHYEAFEGVTVPDGSLSLAEIVRRCDLFIGAGGTMTREIAVLGIPTISVYQDSLLGVDRHLIRRGLMVHKKDLTADFVLQYLRTSRRRGPDPTLMSQGKRAYEMLKCALLEAPAPACAAPGGKTGSTE
ncbi:MAG: DUF354 domain-containing protein [Planctomycetes bacterium]|nr:DUF354 domain-containing protein [Planctomycetota bacterium]